MCRIPFLRHTAALLLGGFLLVSVSTAQDEPMRSLTIQDGQVFLNGTLIPPGELPPTLKTEGIEMQYTFTGDVRPVLEINGDFYVIDANGLRVADASEHDRMSVSLGRRMAPGMPTSNGFGFVVGDDDAAFRSFAAPHVTGVGRQARELAAQAMRFQELQSQLEHEFEQGEMEELTKAAARLSRQAEEAALAAEALPRLEVQNYLAGVQKHDRELFDLLVREREIESETIRLAGEIRAAAEGRERDEQIEELRQKLEEAFELKQANRRREISQLEDRLNDLQQRLEERQRMRAEIIDNRLRQLLHIQNEFKW